MDDDKRLHAAAAVAAIIALVMLVLQYAGRPAAGRSAGPGWLSRISAFGSSPSDSPAPASAAPELAAPERMMTSAATRQFSSPTSAGSAGGLAGAEPTPAASAAVKAPMISPNLLAGGGLNLPSGGYAPTAGGGFPPGPEPGGGARKPAAAGRSAAASGAVPGAAAGAGGAAAFNSAAAAGAAAGASPGGPRLNPMGANGVPPAASLNDPAMASGAGGGGGGGGAGGGGGGGGTGAGKVPDAKPKESAGKPAGVDTSAAAPGSGPPAGTDAPGEITPSQPVIGAPQLGTTTVNGGMFKSSPDGPADVPTMVYVTANGSRAIKFKAKFAIDADGAGDAWKGDRTGQPQTALQYKDGTSLNPRTLPFIVVPTDFQKTHPTVKLGDYAAVTYGAKTLYAIVGDKGPAGVLGEGSMALAAGLGINPDPNRGGITRKDVEYVILPGSRDAEPPRDAAAIQTQGKKVFDAAGAPVR